MSGERAGGFPDVPADPSTTGQVMEFVVGMPTGQPDPSTPVENLVLNAEPTYNLATPAPNGPRLVGDLQPIGVRVKCESRGRAHPPTRVDLDCYHVVVR